MLVDDGLVVREDGRWVAAGDLSTGHRPALDPGAAGLASGPPHARGARGARGGGGRRQGVLRGRGARPRGRGRRHAGARGPDGARPQGADPARALDPSGRGRVPVPSPADPRRRVRGDPEGPARRAARALRRLARARGRGRGRRAGGDRRVSPRAGSRVPDAARPRRTNAPRRSVSRASAHASRRPGEGRPAGAITSRPRTCSAEPWPSSPTPRHGAGAGALRPRRARSPGPAKPGGVRGLRRGGRDRVARPAIDRSSGWPGSVVPRPRCSRTPTGSPPRSSARSSRKRSVSSRNSATMRRSRRSGRSSRRSSGCRAGTNGRRPRPAARSITRAGAATSGSLAGPLMISIFAPMLGTADPGEGIRGLDDLERRSRAQPTVGGDRRSPCARTTSRCRVPSPRPGG